MKKEKGKFNVMRKCYPSTIWTKHAVEGWILPDTKHGKLTLHKWEDSKIWTVSEWSTGAKVGEGDTIEKAIKKGLSNISRNSKDFKTLKAEFIKESGLCNEVTK